jgi:hypothetical protein
VCVCVCLCLCLWCVRVRVCVCVCLTESCCLPPKAPMHILVSHTAQLAWMFGGQLWDDTTYRFRGVLDSPENVAALEFMKVLYNFTSKRPHTSHLGTLSASACGFAAVDHCSLAGKYMPTPTTTPTPRFTPTPTRARTFVAESFLLQTSSAAARAQSCWSGLAFSVVSTPWPRTAWWRTTSVRVLECRCV